jgi:cytochrome c
MRRYAPLVLVLVILAACEQEEPPARLRVIDGDPDLGRVMIASYGCDACHQIPGIRQASGTVGPTLAGFGRRAYIAGHLPNRPALLTAWLRDPPALDPVTAMPALGISEQEARHMAAYLYTLR